jgi:DNA-binding NtrC family response regulator
VRELRNAVARSVALGEEPIAISSRGGAGPADSLPEEAPASAGPVSGGLGNTGAGDALDAIVASGLPYPLARRKALDEFERRYVEQILHAHGGNVAKAARASGLALRYFRLVKGRVQRR